MPRTELTVEQMNWKTGLDATATAGDQPNQHEFLNTAGDVFLRFITTGTIVTVTIITPKTIGSQLLAVEDVVIVLDATGAKYVGPFPTDTFNQTDQKVWFDLDVDTGLTIECVRHGENS